MKLVSLILAACTVSPPRAVKTEASMLAWRLAHKDCPDCRVGAEVSGECCTDLYGLTWSPCAWNAEGRYLTREQLMSPKRLAGCGTDGFPDCRRSP